MSQLLSNFKSNVVYFSNVDRNDRVACKQKKTEKLIQLHIKSHNSENFERQISNGILTLPNSRLIQSIQNDGKIFCKPIQSKQ